LSLDCFGQRDQAVGFTAHRGHHYHHLMTFGAPARHTARNIFDALGAAD
jgi:hypothetical protein